VATDLYSARDAQQTDLLIRKYFRKGDIYVHSDIENSSVVIIKNHSEQGMIPPGTLSQAGVMAIATSRAWDVKQGTTSKSPRISLFSYSPALGGSGPCISDPQPPRVLFKTTLLSREFCSPYLTSHTNPFLQTWVYCDGVNRASHISMVGHLLADPKT